MPLLFLLACVFLQPKLPGVGDVLRAILNGLVLYNDRLFSFSVAYPIWPFFRFNTLGAIMLDVSLMAFFILVDICFLGVAPRVTVNSVIRIERHKESRTYRNWLRFRLTTFVLMAVASLLFVFHDDILWASYAIGGDIPPPPLVAIFYEVKYLWSVLVLYALILYGQAQFCDYDGYVDHDSDLLPPDFDVRLDTVGWHTSEALMAGVYRIVSTRMDFFRAFREQAEDKKADFAKWRCCRCLPEFFYRRTVTRGRWSHFTLLEWKIVCEINDVQYRMLREVFSIDAPSISRGSSLRVAADIFQQGLKLTRLVAASH
ncbi:hypothetical protein JKP88DRAFT_247845 [Tribonema minus]|uniref:Uncharacterized protein n=1 Tax=Tribonema minus TaxID=303371 RepID=A0A835YP91_9STRA|nr:hypothetical protein JKP88DRAFT_247845 [Tribonema minus]